MLDMIRCWRKLTLTCIFWQIIEQEFSTVLGNSPIYVFQAQEWQSSVRSMRNIVDLYYVDDLWRRLLSYTLEIFAVFLAKIIP
jgi:Na+/H+ antiporter NhaC